MKHLGIKFTAGLVLALGLAVPQAHAVILDLTGTTTEGMILTAIFSRTNKTGTGTGNIDAFVQIDGLGGGVEDAYNTTVDNTFNNKSSDQHNHALLLSAVPVVTIDNVLYREFLLDIGEPGEDPDKFLSLDDIQIFVSTTPNQGVETCNGGGACPGLVDLSGTLVYRLDGGADSQILLDSTLAGGQGQDDMFAYIPDSLFPGLGTQNIYLYSRFGEGGGGYANQGAFEEWAVRVVDNPPCEQTRTCSPPPPPPVIPEPSSLMLLSTGVLGALGFSGTRRRA